ncbi:DUF3592 domain-containing protein [Halomonas nitroreducens]|uniref:DUF3592 domain-containing protein n=1 Tax=Halomonas nitroreducens TaxID=447425 RepID=A0A3S0JTJ2_9GAMM|nr:DUF3592 domain-containing protein [Halomonas nitroreducens]RTQ98708.1 DUF3592 domain-containing protein [Halomonas nitroreducens]
MPDIAPFIALGAGLAAVIAGHGAWRRQGVNRWPMAEARVTRCEVEGVHGHAHRREGDDQPRRFLARVQFTFKAEGRIYCSDNGRFGGVPSFTTRQAADAHAGRTPPGTRMTIRYAPGNPETTLLGEPRLPTGRLGLALFLTVMSGLALWLSLP